MPPFDDAAIESLTATVRAQCEVLSDLSVQVVIQKKTIVELNATVGKLQDRNATLRATITRYAVRLDSVLDRMRNSFDCVSSAIDEATRPVE